MKEQTENDLNDLAEFIALYKRHPEMRRWIKRMLIEQEQPISDRVKDLPKW